MKEIIFKKKKPEIGIHGRDFKKSKLFAELETLLPALERANEKLKTMDRRDIDIENIGSSESSAIIEMNLDLGVFDVLNPAASMNGTIKFKEDSESELEGEEDESSSIVKSDEFVQALNRETNIPICPSRLQTTCESEPQLQDEEDKVSEYAPLIQLLMIKQETESGDNHKRIKRKLTCKLNESAPSILKQVLLDLGWEIYNEETMSGRDWDLNWKGSRFTKSEYQACKIHQRMNHFPGTGVVTRKEELNRLFNKLRGIYSNIFDFTPISFCVPNEYKKFLREYQLDADKGKKNVWISKPADLSRGRGIYLFRDLHELSYDCNTIVQRYIEDPLLVSGFKFDIRCYVLVRSYDPLVVYFYNDGLARFATELYDLSEGQLRNSFSHLTNTSINRLGPSLHDDKDEVGPGCKWSFNKLRNYFDGRNLDHAAIFQKIKSQILLTLAPIADQIPKESPPGLFELYGFDFIIDSRLNTWLLEVNLSPSLSIDSDVDTVVKRALVNDILLLLDFSDPNSRNSMQMYTPRRVGKFERLYPHNDLPSNSRNLTKLLKEIQAVIFS